MMFGLAIKESIVDWFEDGGGSGGSDDDDDEFVFVVAAKKMSIKNVVWKCGGSND